MSKKDKPKRLITIRDFSHPRSWEAVEINSFGFLHWIGLEIDLETNQEITFSFPVDVNFLASKFEETGRMFDTSLLPENVKDNPYEHWL